MTREQFFGGEQTIGLVMVIMTLIGLTCAAYAVVWAVIICVSVVIVLGVSNEYVYHGKS